MAILIWLLSAMLLSRGNPEVEAVLNKGLNYVSGPQWLAEHVLQDKWVLGRCRNPRQNHYIQYAELDP